jgi:hypothetical protein
MKYILTLILFTFFATTKAIAGFDPLTIKAKIVLKNKTAFTAYYYGWDIDISEGYTLDQVCTDKGFQQFLIRQNNNCGTDSKTGKSIKGVRLYKNVYGISKPDTMQIPVLGFCQQSDRLDIDANDILYTVFLDANSSNFPQFETWGVAIEILDSAGVKDLIKNKIVTYYSLTDSNDLSYAFHFITTDKTISTKKLKQMVQSKKYDVYKMASNSLYFKKIQKEMSKQRIYVFAEYSD